jgi:pimeloyl-ACP methyl ester carboxylesterase
MITQDKTSPTQFYTWNNYRCAYEVHQPVTPAEGIPLLLIHPIGVGLSRQFWQRFCREWYNTGHSNVIYNPDLLGCGESEMPHVAGSPIDWALQLQELLKTVIKKPVIVLVQGALLPVAIRLVEIEPDLVCGLVLAGPPAWSITTRRTPDWQNKVIWNLLDSPLGNLFYRYARREEFLRNFSVRQLFDAQDAVDAEWLDTLQAGAENMASRYAVFAFLAGFWREDYQQAIASIKQPTLVVVGETASSISREGKALNPDELLADYLKCLPNGQGIKITGRNVLPYESTASFVAGIAPFIKELGM